MLDRREWMAFSVAPVFPVLPFAFISFDSEPKLKLIVISVATFVSYGSCLVFCVSIPRALRSKSVLSVATVVLCGSVFGAAVLWLFGLLFVAILGSSTTTSMALNFLGWGALLGISVALPFSVIAGYPVLRTKG